MEHAMCDRCWANPGTTTTLINGIQLNLCRLCAWAINLRLHEDKTRQS